MEQMLRLLHGELRERERETEKERERETIANVI